jgi:hypothetical protein
MSCSRSSGTALASPFFFFFFFYSSLTSHHPVYLPGDGRSHRRKKNQHRPKCYTPSGNGKEKKPWWPHQTAVGVWGTLCMTSSPACNPWRLISGAGSSAYQHPSQHPYGHYHRWRWLCLSLQHRSIPYPSNPPTPLHPPNLHHLPPKPKSPNNQNRRCVDQP